MANEAGDAFRAVVAERDALKAAIREYVRLKAVAGPFVGGIVEPSLRQDFKRAWAALKGIAEADDGG